MKQSIMKRIILFFCLYLIVSSSQGQVLLKTQLPVSGLVLKSQLWNLSLVNTSAQSLNVKIEMLFTNISNGQKIMSGVSKVFRLPRGAYQVNPGNVAPVIYNILSPGYNLNINQDGFLPVGMFNVCYTLIGSSGDAAAVPLIDECESIEVEPINPPILVSPADRDTIDVSRPVFNWLPPAPASSFNNLSYDFILVEVVKTQTASVAIQQNLPLHFQQNISLTNLQYPLALPELDTSKTYAWQVVAKSGQSPIAKSEVWAFNLKNYNKEILQKTDPDYYMKVKKEIDASFSVCYGLLRFSYNNEINDKTVFAKIFDITNAKQKELTLDSSAINVEYGENFKQLDLSSEAALKDKHIYLLDLKNSNEEHWYLKFEYRKPKTKL